MAGNTGLRCSNLRNRRLGWSAWFNSPAISTRPRPEPSGSEPTRPGGRRGRRRRRGRSHDCRVRRRLRCEAAAAGLAAPRDVPAVVAAGIVLIALSPSTAGAVPPRSSPPAPRCCSGPRRLPPGQLVAARDRRAQALRPLQHLPDHRRQLHAVRGRAAARGQGPDPAARGLGRRPRRRRCSACSGSARRAGSTRRCTSRSAGSPCFYLPEILRTGGAAVSTLISVGGLLYTAGARRLRHQAAQPQPPLVRLPRDLPRAAPSPRSSCTTSRCRSWRTPTRRLVTRVTARVRPTGAALTDRRRLVAHLPPARVGRRATLDQTDGGPAAAPTDQPGRARGCHDQPGRRSGQGDAVQAGGRRVARGADDRDLARAVHGRLGDRQPPAGEPRRGRRDPAISASARSAAPRLAASPVSAAQDSSAPAAAATPRGRRCRRDRPDRRPPAAASSGSGSSSGVS